jgi:hypothetical protein
LRVYYNVLADHKKVRVVAIGRKEGGSVIIGGEVVQL